MDVKVTVEFCMMWNYTPKAASFAEDVFNHFRSRITYLGLIPSKGGAFEIFINKKKIYSKLETGAFPVHEEIIRKIEELLA